MQRIWFHCVYFKQNLFLLFLSATLLSLSCPLLSSVFPTSSSTFQFLISHVTFWPLPHLPIPPVSLLHGLLSSLVFYACSHTTLFTYIQTLKVIICTWEITCDFCFLESGSHNLIYSCKFHNFIVLHGCWLSTLTYLFLPYPNTIIYSPLLSCCLFYGAILQHFITYSFSYITLQALHFGY